MKTESNNKLTKKDLRKLAFRSVLLQASFNYERMQAAGWTCALLPFLKKIHNNDKEKVSQSMKDNLEFINTNPTLVGFLMGLVLSLEENSEDRSLIKGLKVALFGPLAGIGDALLWFTLLPIVAGISASFASQGSILGPILFFGVYVCVFLSRIIWASAGYKLGVKAIDVLKENSKSISKAATTLGVTVIGGLIASYVHITLLPSISISADHAISLQTDFVDKILPNILPMGYTLLMFYFLKKKNVNPTMLILVTFALAILLSLVGVL
ncbi:PTS galactosamine transporter subunit IID [Clostridium beijerinckii]|uniref:Mannose permease IID component n=1 Tax=Clostridium beijerinckii TaxID=1520 RepID=A0A1S8RRJ7_CLOBE|nr:PTS galactosamine transporter subunit IID [Clostridium beijerinckii]NRY63927.1 PTS system galactosamine-specific IID component [Clostridium beijerinckii]OOM55729.1 mannose permease IID component [Clostridium beijerinckii]